jgi:hypothetical protein
MDSRVDAIQVTIPGVGFMVVGGPGDYSCTADSVGSGSVQIFVPFATAGSFNTGITCDLSVAFDAGEESQHAFGRFNIANHSEARRIDITEGTFEAFRVRYVAPF